MIFVTVGTYNFDLLIMQIDKLVGDGFFTGEKVICQIGSGEYEPKNCEYIRYADSLQNFYDDAKFIICHGGTGSTSDCIRKEKSFISVANVALTDNHQTEFLKALSSEIEFTWTDDPEKISTLYELAKTKISSNKIDTLFDDLNVFIAR